MAAFIQFVLSFGLLNQLTLHIIGLIVTNNEQLSIAEELNSLSMDIGIGLLDAGGCS